MTLSLYHIPHILIKFISLHLFHMPHSLKHACMTCMSFHQSIRQDYKLERSVSAKVVTKTPDGIQLPENTSKTSTFRVKTLRREVSDVNVVVY
jgi:hypothetical protein